MADIATLGLRVDESGFVQGVNRAEQAVRRLGQTEKATLAEHQRVYAQRVANARAAYQAEVEAAQRAMRERLRATTSSGEVRAAQEMYRKRVQAAQQAARAEVQLAQQAHLAATQGMRPLVGATNEFVAASRRGVPTINTLRSSMTTMAASALSAVPGVTQFTSALGAMAIGSAWMVGIMAGIAALGFAWDKLREGARQAKKEFEELKRAIESAADARVPESVKAQDRLRGAQQELGAAASALVAAQRGRRIETAQGGVMTIVSQGEISKARERFNEAVRLVKLAQQEITEIHKEELRKRNEDLVRGMSIGLAEQERLNREAERRQREHDERMASMARYRMILERERLFGTRFTMNVPGGATSTSAGGVTRFGDGRVLVGGNLPREMTPPVPGAGVMGFLRGVGQNVLSNLNPMMIASNLASQALGRIAGGIGRFVGGILGIGGAAEEAERRMRQFRKEFDESMQNLRFRAAGDSVGAEVATLERERDRMRQQAMLADPAGFLAQSLFPGSEAAKRFRAVIEEIDRSFATLIENAQKLAEVERRRASEDLGVRALVAQGRNAEAEAMRMQLQRQREIEDAIRNNMGAAYLEQLRYVHGLEEQAEAARAAREAIRGTTEALNGPEGLRLSLLRWRASQFSMPANHVVAPAGGMTWVNTTRQDSGTLISGNTIVIQANTREDGQVILDRVLEAARKRARASGRNPLTTEVKAR